MTNIRLICWSTPLVFATSALTSSLYLPLKPAGLFGVLSVMWTVPLLLFFHNFVRD